MRVEDITYIWLMTRNVGASCWAIRDEVVNDDVTDILMDTNWMKE